MRSVIERDANLDCRQYEWRMGSFRSALRVKYPRLFAASLQVPFGFREMRGVFMGTGKYNGKRIRDFYLPKTSRGFITEFISIAVPLGFAFAGQPRRLSLREFFRTRTLQLAESVLEHRPHLVS